MKHTTKERVIVTIILIVSCTISAIAWHYTLQWHYTLSDKSPDQSDTNKVYVTYHYKSKEHSVTDSMVYIQKTCDWGFNDTNALDWKIKDQLAETYPNQDFERVSLHMVPLAQHKGMLENNQNN